MRWFTHLKTRSKLLVAFGAQCALLMTLSAIAYATLAAIDNNERMVVDKANHALVAVMQTRSHLNRIRGRMFELFVTTGEAEKAAIKQEVAERIDQVKRLIREIEAHLQVRHDTPGLAQIIDIEKRYAVFLEGRAEVARLIEAGKTDEASRMLLGVQRTRFEGIRAEFLTLSDRLDKGAAAAVAESQRFVTVAVGLFITLVIAAFLLAFYLTWLMHRLIAAPLQEFTQMAQRVASGDLTVQVAASDRSDEVGAMQRALAAMIDNLRSMNGDLREGLAVLHAASAEILATVSQVAASAAETATAVSQTSTTAEEVKQTAHLSSQKAQVVLQTAQRNSTVSEAGRRAVAETIEGMGRIREQMESIAETVVRLSEQGQTIGEIIAMVNDLAEQSNLLAVNAAIEAARAGEHGKAFGVVAQEVKSLAEQSRQATAQVRTILMDVQKATSAAVMATEQGAKSVAAGAKQASEAGESIRLLAGSVGEAAQVATQIAASSQQQLVGMDQIASAIGSIRQATTQNLAGTRQLEASVEGLQDLGNRVRNLVERQHTQA